MRRTFSQLIQDSKNLAFDDNSISYGGIESVEDFIKNSINQTVEFIKADCGIFKTKERITLDTVEDQIYYDLPIDVNQIESATLELNGIDYPLRFIHDQVAWDETQEIDVMSVTIPQYIFFRGDDVGIYPTPSTDDLTITLVINTHSSPMSHLDENNGEVDVTNGSTTVEGTDTVFDDWMVGAYFKSENDSYFYKIASVTDSDTIELAKNYEGSTATGLSFNIGQSPDIPQEFHRFIPYRVASLYYAGYRSDMTKAQNWSNYFFTEDFNNNNKTNYIRGGYLGAKYRYNNQGRNTSQIVYTNKPKQKPFEYQNWALDVTVE